MIPGENNHVAGVCRLSVGCPGAQPAGASHVRQALPNQDAIANSVAKDGLPPVVLAVADGHGSPKSFRSDKGAQFAVEAAVEVCREFLDSMKEAGPSAVKTEAKLRIPPRIFQRWRQRMEEHYGQNGFTDTELNRLAEQAGQAVRERAAGPEQRAVAYGSTLLVAVVTEEFLVCFQLGDGDILAVSRCYRCRRAGRPQGRNADRQRDNLPVPGGGAAVHAVWVSVVPGRPPAMVLLSTDGYCNSFATPDAFLKVGTDYLDMLRTEGSEEIEKGLPGWLEDTSRNGSGDDITVGIIYRRKPLLCRPVVVGQETA